MKRPRHRCETCIKIDCTETGCGNFIWTEQLRTGTVGIGHFGSITKGNFFNVAVTYK